MPTVPMVKAPEVSAAGTTTVNIQGGPLIMENDAQMRRFASTINETNRCEEGVGR